MTKIFCLLLLLISGTITAQQTPDKTQVLLLGTFHFDNPGLDVAKFENADVLSAKRQKEILEVVKQLKEFGPELIFIESEPIYQGYYDSLLKAYKSGQYPLKANETYQLGFRLAKELNMPNLTCVDYRDADFPFDSLMKVMLDANQTDLAIQIKMAIDSIEKAHNHQIATLDIKNMLIQGNSKFVREISTGFYFRLLKAGNKDNHVGSYLVSEWWRRNMVIYENILKRLTGKEKRILVIFGSAHTALLHEFMKYNESLELVEVGAVLK
ncbi:MAG: DUF5694 domain-containing protein [Chitinophagaceae bacterium]